MKDFSLKIGNEAVEVINQHGVDTFPNECCGFLYGNETDGRQITLAVPVTNTKEGDQRRRFEISPLDYLRAEQFALVNGTQLLGVYHSHPNHPAIPSIHDLAVALPYFSYIIVSIMDGEIADLKSWIIKEDAHEFQEQPVMSNIEV